jgi:hypothetical protein
VNCIIVVGIIGGIILIIATIDAVIEEERQRK